MIAEKKGMEEDELVEMILSSQGPRCSGTQGQPVRFFDDKQTYTGVFASNGGKGPTNVDLGTSDLKYITNRTEATVRGVNVVEAKHVAF